MTIFSFLSQKIEQNKRSQIIEDIHNNSAFDKSYFMLIMLSTIIATAGLIVNNSAVIIGAMIIAPLMWPILSVGMAIVKGNPRDVLRALSQLIIGILLSLFFSLIITKLTPISSFSEEILKRVNPGIIDIIIAFASGIVASLSLSWTKVSNAIAGVAIAASLLPPLCVLGISISSGEYSLAYGALLLFLANIIAIMLASVVSFWMLGFKPPHKPEDQMYMKIGVIVSVIIFIIFLIPLGFFILSYIEQETLYNKAKLLLVEKIHTIDEHSKVKIFNVKDFGEYMKIESDIFFPSNTMPRYRLENVYDDYFTDLYKKNVVLEFNMIPIVVEEET